MYRTILRDSLPKNHALYNALVHYDRLISPGSPHYNITGLLIYFAANETNECCRLLAKHLGNILSEDRGAAREVQEEINTCVDGDHVLLSDLFERCALPPILVYMECLPITGFNYKDAKGNTILHQLAIACKNIFNSAYNTFFEEEIDDNFSLPHQIQYAQEILNYLLAQHKDIVDLLLTKDFIFNNKNESALSIFLHGYKNYIYLDFSDSTDAPSFAHMPFVKDLLTRYPKSIIVNGIYDKLCSDANHFNNSHQFLKNKLMEALLDKHIIQARAYFYNNDPKEHISERDLVIGDMRQPEFLDREETPRLNRILIHLQYDLVLTAKGQRASSWEGDSFILSSPSSCAQSSSAPQDGYLANFLTQSTGKTFDYR